MPDGCNNDVAHVFGPVPSRRLGFSLGVDLVPHKVCTMDCAYCQVGHTTRKTIERQVFVPAETVLLEIGKKLGRGHKPDYITLAGSGEPTLHAGLGDIIDGIKRITDVPVAILTNGSLLWDPEVRRACAKAHLVLPSLDAGDEETFRAINRPADDLTLARVVEGLIEFRKEFDGRIWLEVFIIKGVNSHPDHVARIRALAERIRPDRIQLNTAVRPTADEGVEALNEDELNAICRLMGPDAEVIADFSRAHERPSVKAKADEVLAMIRRRPVTLDDIASGLGAHRAEVLKYVDQLLAGKLIAKERRGDREFFRAK